MSVSWYSKGVSRGAAQLVVAKINKVTALFAWHENAFHLKTFAGM